MVADQPALSVANSGQVVPAEMVSSLIVAAHHGGVSAKPGDEGGLRVEVTMP